MLLLLNPILVFIISFGVVMNVQLFLSLIMHSLRVDHFKKIVHERMLQNSADECSLFTVIRQRIFAFSKGGNTNFNLLLVGKSSSSFYLGLLTLVVLYQIKRDSFSSAKRSKLFIFTQLIQISS